jgi:hypothetical protein
MASPKNATIIAIRPTSLMSEPLRLEHGDGEVDEDSDRNGDKDALYYIHPSELLSRGNDAARNATPLSPGRQAPNGLQAMNPAL